MSTQYPGGFITKSPVAPTSTAASGIWTVDQALQYVKAGTWPTPPPFIEDVFSTYLYTGNGSTQTITNNVNLSTGGMVWLKSRSSGVYNHFLMDTARGVQSELSTNNADFANTANAGYDLTAFTSTGFTLGPVDKSGLNNNGSSQVSWSFKKQPFFFDIVTYTGTGANRTISHNLGSVPGCIIVKQTAPSSTNWQVYHRSLANTQYMVLNDTAAAATGATRWNSTTPTASVFSVGTDSTVNALDSTYVAYLFAHDAGGFMGSGGSVTNGISCGNFSFVAGKATVTLGYEPQYLLLKRTGDIEQWWVFDVMRGMTASLTGNNYLGPNTTTAENDLGSITQPTATGFYLDWSNNGVTTGNYIYVAIRRGPMKVPTVGTSVYKTVVSNPTNSGTSVNGAGFPPDFNLGLMRGGSGVSQLVFDRLRGGSQYLVTALNSAEATASGNNFLQDGFYYSIASGENIANTFIRRAPSFFDEVCYTGTGVVTNFSHNLGVAPELMIFKRRSGASPWSAYSAALGNTNFLELNTTDASSTNSTYFNSTTPTSSVFTLGTSISVNSSGSTWVAYLFATCAGVSKVGSYTGTAALQTVNCGFTSGARFVLIKRTDSTGDWWTFDSVRGITSGNDPYLFLNSSAAETTGTNYVDTDTTGFKVTAAAPAGLNAVGGTYIFLAIA